MPPPQGFSFATVVLSYFLVGGGMFTAMLIAGFAKIQGEVPMYLIMASGAFVGGFVAGRASRVSTVLEPAIGGIAVVGTIVGLAAGTDIGKFLWHVAPDATMKFVAMVGGLAAGGALGGAFVSEKLLGEASPSSLPWVIYTAFATFGACVIATVIGSVLIASSASAESNHDELGKMLLAGIAVGCLIAGVAVGASARSRPLGAAFLGSALGTAGFALLIAQAATGGRVGGGDSMAIVGVFAAGGGVVTFLGTLIGWAVIGKKHAG